MNAKAEKIKDAINNVKQPKVVLYHIMNPINSADFTKIKQSGYFEPSKNALGGQSDGYYFFTTYIGAKNHIETVKDTWGKDADKHAYIIECEINMDTVKYPVWKLDYEAMQDFLFDMIYDAVSDDAIKFNGTEVSATDDKKLVISRNGKFSRIKEFSANEHSGLIEDIADFLYKHNAQFKKSYDDLLQNVFRGQGDNQELYAVKTTQKQKITKITEIQVEQPVATNSQIDKFLSRYGRARR